jgi:DNA-binding NtrC family response regulator
MMPKRILVVDDEQSMRDTLQMMLEKEGFEVDSADNGKNALALFNTKKYDLVLTDLKMPELDGIGLIDKLSQTDVPIIIMTAFASKDEAIRALNMGASFFIEKPFKKPELLNFINRSIKMDELMQENRSLRETRGKEYGIESIIGTSAGITEVKEMIKKVAATESSILLTGESGTGKEVAARAIHTLSGRSGGPFVAINCGAIPSELLESELFGHVKGSFTGAIRDKTGLMEQANGGTFFLDEVGNTSPSIQMKILRAIQEREVLPVGGQQARKVDIRILAATNENLEEAITRSDFRKDLFYRLNVINIHIPPLRERREDIELLFTYFLRRKDASGIFASFLLGGDLKEKLESYDWPGNIRELENVVERLMALSMKGRITADMLPEHFIKPREPKLVAEGSNIIPNMDEIEKAYIHWVLMQHGGQKQKAAEVLGIGRSTLDRKIEKYGL